MERGGTSMCGGRKLTHPPPFPLSQASLTRMPFVYDTSRPLRIGLLPKGAAKDATVWFELPPAMIFHVANAWVDPATPSLVRLFACCFETFDLDLDTDGRAAFDGFARLCEITLDTATGRAARRVLTNLHGDFPVVPASLVGSPTRYAYVATVDTAQAVPLFTGVAKIDLTAPDPASAVVGHVHHGPGRHGGECAFVPDPARPGREDGGFLVGYVHEEGRPTSELVVYDAATMAAAPVARVGLPARVPFGFHVAHVAEAALGTQEA